VAVAAPENGKCDFRFEGCGLIRLRLVTAQQHLDVLTSSDLPSGSSLLDKKRWTEVGALPKPKQTRVTCASCKKRLTARVFDKTKTMKACVACSTANGREHVFRAYPADFLAAEGGGDDAEPNDCLACQSGQPPADAGKTCGTAAA
jgi:hypothetical protein